MLDTLVTNLVGSLADLIASTATTMADDHQARRDKLADYEAKASQNAGQVLTGVVGAVQSAVRNRYQDWLAHPRLGHEAPAAELRAAEIGLNEAVMELKASPSLLNQAMAVAASIRLTAITEALGAACIYQDTARRRAPVTAKRTAKPVRDGDKRLNRRVPVIDDVPDALRPVVARLGVSHPERAGAIQELEAARSGPLDDDGIATRLATLVAQTDHQAFVETLAAQAATTAESAAAIPVAADKIVATDSAPPLPSRSMPKLPSAATATAPPPRTDGDIAADVAAVTKFIAGNGWALIERAGRYSLRRLDKRAEINTAFDRVADLPAMQDALGRIHVAQRSSKS